MRRITTMKPQRTSLHMISMSATWIEYLSQQPWCWLHDMGMLVLHEKDYLPGGIQCWETMYKVSAYYFIFLRKYSEYNRLNGYMWKWWDWCSTCVRTATIARGSALIELPLSRLHETYGDVMANLLHYWTCVQPPVTCRFPSQSA